MPAEPSASRGAVVVTGAGGSLGRATALRLAADGYAVAPLGRPGSTLDETVALLKGSGAPILPLEVDLHDTDALSAALERAERELAPLSALINNAAIYPTTGFLDISVAEFRDVVAVNQTAYFVGAQSAARLMIPRRTGCIVNVGSITWHGGWAKLASYVTTKGAAVGMTRALARELGPHGIRVNAVSPGAFPTKAEEIHDDPEGYARFVLDHQALKRRGTPAEFAAVVAFLIGEDAAFLTGQTVNVDGGWVME